MQNKLQPLYLIPDLQGRWFPSISLSTNMNYDNKCRISKESLDSWVSLLLQVPVQMESSLDKITRKKIKTMKDKRDIQIMSIPKT